MSLRDMVSTKDLVRAQMAGHSDALRASTSEVVLGR